jgi:hypothetical protein
MQTVKAPNVGPSRGHCNAYGNALALGVAIQTLKAPELDSIVMRMVKPGPWVSPYRHLRHQNLTAL